MNEECGSCEYNRQCFIKKNVGIFECEKEIKEAIEALPKTNNTISAYGSIDINELYKTIEKFKKVPDYNELMKDNNNLQQKVEEKNKEINRLNNLIDELEAMIQGDIDGFSTINEFGSCDDILELLQIYKDKLKELKEDK